MQAAPPVDALVATAQHIDLLHRKRARLSLALEEACEQYLTAFERQFAARPDMTPAELLAIYQTLRGEGPCVTGLTKRFEQVIGMNVTKLKHRADRESRIHAGPWAGHFPLHAGEEWPLRGQAVVYVLYDAANDPVYVGSTSNLKERFKAHRKAGKRWTSWTANLCANREAAYQMESRYLRQYMPQMNKRRSA